MHFHEMFKVQVDEGIRLEILSKKDSFIINSLLNCAIDWPIIFSLVWGGEIAMNAHFPDELRKAVADIFLEMSKKEECRDPQEKKVHSIVIDLLYLLYEKQIYDTIEAAAGKDILDDHEGRWEEDW